MARVDGIALTQPRTVYAQKNGGWRAYRQRPFGGFGGQPLKLKPRDLAQLKEMARETSSPPKALPTIAQLASDATPN